MVQQNMWFYQKYMFWFDFTDKKKKKSRAFWASLRIFIHYDVFEHLRSFFWQTLTEIEKYELIWQMDSSSE